MNWADVTKLKQPQGSDLYSPRLLFIDLIYVTILQHVMYAHGHRRNDIVILQISCYTTSMKRHCRCDFGLLQYIICLAEDTHGYNPRITFSGNPARTDQTGFAEKKNNECESCIGLDQNDLWLVDFTIVGFSKHIPKEL